MLSDSSQHQNMPSPKVRGVWHYPDSTKTDALKLWLVTGNLRQVSASMNIPYDTLKTWRHSKWWAELSTEIRTEGHLALSAKMQKLADKAMELTLDRLENGEEVVIQKTGEVIRKGVSMRDAHQVAVSFQDRALKLQNSPQEEAAQLAVHDRLAQLADAFSKMAGKTRKVEVLDVTYRDTTDAVQIEGSGEMDVRSEAENGEEVGSEDTFDQVPSEQEEREVNAVHDQWEEGLQEGVELGEDQGSAPLEGPSPEDSSPEVSGERDRESTQ